MNNNSGAQLIITKRYLSQRPAKCNEVLLRKGDVYLGNEMIKRNSNEGNMKVIVPNENFKPGKIHQFHNFVQYVQIYSCIGNLPEDFDTRHCFDTEI